MITKIQGSDIHRGNYIKMK